MTITSDQDRIIAAYQLKIAALRNWYNVGGLMTPSAFTDAHRILRDGLRAELQSLDTFRAA